MKKKTILSFIIAALLLSTTGCKEKTTLSPDNPVTLSMWHVYGEQADSTMNRLIDEFNATVGREKGIIISVTNVTNTSQIGGQLMDALEDNPGALEIPDIFSSHTNTAAAIGSDQLVDFNKYFSSEELSEYVPQFIEEGTFDEELNVFPVSKSSYALFINGSQFERFSADTGITYEDLSTWDGFFHAAAQYHTWSGGKTFCAFDYLIRHVELDILAKNQELTYTDNGWYDFDSQPLKDSWMMFATSLAQGHIAISDLYANTQVMTGEALSGIGSTAAIGYYNDVVTYPDNTSEPTNLQVLPLPKTGNGQQYMPQTGVGLCAYETTEQKAEAASVFVRWFTEGQRNLDFVVETGYMPVNNSAYDAIADYSYPSEGYANLYNAIHTMKENYIPVVRPTFDNYYTKVDELYNGLRKMQPSLSQRSDNGEDPALLAEETWAFFQTIQ